MSKEFNVNMIIRKDDKTNSTRPNVGKVSETQAEVEGAYFVSPSGKHKTKMVVHQVGNSSNKYDFVKGNNNLDISLYSIGEGSDNKVSFEGNRQVFNNKEEKVEYPTFNPETLKPSVSLKEEINDDIHLNNDEELDVFEEETPSILDNYNERLDRVNEEIKSNINSFDDFGTNVQEINYDRKELDSDFDWDNSSYEEEKQDFKEFDLTRHKVRSDYKVPSLSDLPKECNDDLSDEEFLTEKAKAIDEVFDNFNIGAKVIGKVVGPTVTQFLIDLMPGTNVNKINSVLTNIQLNLALDKDSSVRLIEQIPNTKYMGIEVPNRKRKVVTLSEVLDCDEFRNNKMLLPIAVGKDILGNNIYCDITEMPHCLICGTTKSGKSVCLNTIILSLIYKLSPKDLRFIFVDPKQVELTTYDGIPHLICPVITELEHLKPILNWLIDEMERRYSLLKSYGVRDLRALNMLMKEEGKEKVPFIVFVMDEFADWIQQGGKEVEDMVQRLASKARAAGIHLVLAAQRPSSDLIKGSIKSQFDTRFAFKVTSNEDSRIVLGCGGAEKLVGKGDLLLKYAGSEPDRIQACFIGNDNLEITHIVNKLKVNGDDYIFDLEDLNEQAKEIERGESIEGFDPQFAEIARFIVSIQTGSMQQAIDRFGGGWPRMKKIFKDMEMLSILGHAQKGRPQDVLVTSSELEDILRRNDLD